MNTSSKETVRPINPLWFIPLSFVAGLMGGGPLAGADLCRHGRRRTGWAVGLSFFLIGAALLLLCGLMGTRWYWAALILNAIDLAGGIVLFLLLRGHYKEFQAQRPLESGRGNYRRIITGMAGGALIAALIGTVLSIVYELLSDRIFSTVLPVAFSDKTVLFRVLSDVFFLVIAGIIAGGLLGRGNRRITAIQCVFYSLILVLIHQSWKLGVDALIGASIFQAYSATLGGFGALVRPYILLELVTGCWWTVFLLFFIVSPPRISGRLIRSCAAVAMNLVVALTACVSFGYAPDLLLGLGNHFEREAYPSRAVWCYELALKKEPEQQIASYLQFRVALLNHKLGHEAKALEGFSRVISRYNRNGFLVKKASLFYDSLKRRPMGKRVVLPGVETRTEYKGGYCLPNSLALVMRYWGKDVSAADIGSRITGLGTGTCVVDQSWYVGQQGWRELFLPLADMNDIKRCIDAGFPVLVYVPAHVLAIFGYDEALGTFVTYDVATMDVWEDYVQKEFVKAWKNDATTLVLCYPPGKGAEIPKDIRRRAAGLSEKFLQYQLQFVDRPHYSYSSDHLSKAAGKGGTFFLPVLALNWGYPSLRPFLERQYDPKRITASIRQYFGNDFDEGIHLAGEREYAGTRQSWQMRAALAYLIDNDRFDLVDNLISTIGYQGPVSRETLAEVGLMDLSLGHFTRGLDRILSADENSTCFYAGLAKLKKGDKRGAIEELTRVVSGAT